MFSVKGVARKTKAVPAAVLRTYGTWVRSKVPIFGVTVGLTALCVQMMLLYPAHEEISVKLVRVERIMSRVSAKADTLHDKMLDIVRHEEHSNLQERRILEKEKEIMTHAEKVMNGLDLFIKRQNDQSFKATVMKK